MLSLLLQRGRHTGDVTDPDTSEARRRVMEVVRRGQIKDVDYGRALAKVQFGPQETTWLPWMTARASSDITWWAPEIGEQVMVFSPSGNLKQGVILGSLYQPSGDHPYPAPQNRETIAYVKFGDGTEIWYDRAAQLLEINAVGKVEILAADQVHIKTPLVLIDGNVTINGDVDIVGNVRIDDTDPPSSKGNLRVEHVVEADVAVDHIQEPI